MKKGATVVLCGSIMMLSLTACGKTKINLDDYVELKYEGFDTLGTATYEFDYKQFERDFEETLKLTKEGEDERRDMKEAAEAMGLGKSEPELLATFLKGEIDKSEGLSNGDEVSFTWDIDDEEISELFKVELTYSDITGTVSGLEEAAPFDPFDGYNVTFTGSAPDGRVSIDDKRPADSPRLGIELSQTEGLSNGDVVKATISGYDDVAKYCVENFGKIPTITEKEFTVDSLPSFIQSSSEITDDTLQKMQKQVEDIILGEASGWNAGTLLGQEYLGCYFLTPKAGFSASRHNAVTLVYRVDSHAYYDNGKFEADTSYYYGVTFYDITDLPDGTQSVNLSQYDKRAPYGGHVVDTGYTWWNTPEVIRYNGYHDLDSMFNDLVTKNVENWDYEDTVEDKAPSYLTETEEEEAPAEESSTAE